MRFLFLFQYYIEVIQQGQSSGQVKNRLLDFVGKRIYPVAFCIPKIGFL